ncbi:hypothetical protein CCYS_13965 [Corynebacterium cystitidis DSM 20524]|uniref:Uncharacterized protein n=1 Tax=Corynebacterium cystitidis DSM 20524 TaxID=1121357 RepID=A0A1H9UWN9_9CORY|nr:hypothetical protein CCYS_13965 [Corynebacterium cystitidis DSM 20524]SES13741.1 hypothetical protein SAMN05661109_01962 [Corynebacterium cystitidis DSM 20524]SNV91387.1 Uncharacterised protein [Corynebacterium cystitidis]
MSKLSYFTQSVNATDPRHLLLLPHEKSGLVSTSRSYREQPYPATSLIFLIREVMSTIWLVSNRSVSG